MNTLTVSKTYGRQPALDHFNLEQTLSDISARTQQAQGVVSNIVNVFAPKKPSGSIVVPTTQPPRPVFVAPSFNMTWLIVGVVVVVVGVILYKKFA